MSLSHYEDVYGECLDENVANEFTNEVAVGFKSGSGTAFTEFYKKNLLQNVDKIIAECEAFLQSIEREQDSIERNETELRGFLETLSGVGRAPDNTPVVERLDTIAERRQETVQTDSHLEHVNGHDIRTYLYQDAEWTYPVLTSVVRLRKAIYSET
jgi:hypothetical protein